MTHVKKGLFKQMLAPQQNVISYNDSIRTGIFCRIKIKPTMQKLEGGSSSPKRAKDGRRARSWSTRRSLKRKRSPAKRAARLQSMSKRSASPKRSVRKSQRIKGKAKSPMRRKKRALRGGSLGTLRDVVKTWARKTVEQDAVKIEGSADPNDDDKSTYNFGAIRNAWEVVTQCDRDGPDREEPREVAQAHNFLLYAYTVWTQPQAAKGQLKEREPTMSLIRANENASRDFMRPRCRAKADETELSSANAAAAAALADLDRVKKGASKLDASIRQGIEQERSRLMDRIEQLKREKDTVVAASEKRQATSMKDLAKMIKSLETQLASEREKSESLAKSLRDESKAKLEAIAEAETRLKAAAESCKRDLATAQKIAEAKEEAELERLRSTQAETAKERRTLMASIESKERFLEEARQQFVEFQASSNTEISRLQAALEEARVMREAGNSAMETKCKQKETELEELRTVTKQLQAQNAEITKNSERIQEELSALLSSGRKTEQLSSDQRKEIEKIKNELSEMTKKAEAASKRSADTVEQLQYLKKAYDAAQASQSRLSSLHSDALQDATLSRKEAGQLQAKLNKAQQDSEQCRTALEEATKKALVSGDQATKSVQEVLVAYQQVLDVIDHPSGWWSTSNLIQAIREKLVPVMHLNGVLQDENAQGGGRRRKS